MRASLSRAATTARLSAAKRPTRGRWLYAASLLSLSLALLWRIANRRSFQFFGELVASVPCAGKFVAFTLDDGPTLEGTAALLPLLKEWHARATFFVEGQALERYPEAGRRIVQAGHELGNHSYSHRRMLLRSQGFIRREIEATDAAIVASGQSGPIAFRPPFGKKLLGLPWFLSKTGRTTVMWSIEPESTAGVAQTPARLAAHVLEVVSPGSILLLHAMHDPSGLKIAALRLILEGLTEHGYHVVGFSELQRACAATRPTSG